LSPAPDVSDEGTGTTAGRRQAEKGTDKLTSKEKKRKGGIASIGMQDVDRGKTSPSRTHASAKGCEAGSLGENQQEQIPKKKARKGTPLQQQPQEDAEGAGNRKGNAQKAKKGSAAAAARPDGSTDAPVSRGTLQTDGVPQHAPPKHKAPLVGVLEGTAMIPGGKHDDRAVARGSQASLLCQALLGHNLFWFLVL
jgi:hypothetical protein